MRRLKDERGAVAIIVAAIMVPLLICTALVVDMGSAYVRKRELQNAADAAALAIALDCAGGHCGSITTTASTFAQANVGSGACHRRADRSPAVPPRWIPRRSWTSRSRP